MISIAIRAFFKAIGWSSFSRDSLGRFLRPILGGCLLWALLWLLVPTATLFLVLDLVVKLSDLLEDRVKGVAIELDVTVAHGSANSI